MKRAERDGGQQGTMTSRVSVRINGWAEEEDEEPQESSLPSSSGKKSEPLTVAGKV